MTEATRMAPPPAALAELIEAQAEALGDRPFLVMEDRTVTLRDLNRHVNRAANGLAGRRIA